MRPSRRSVLHVSVRIMVLYRRATTDLLDVHHHERVDLWILLLVEAAICERHDGQVWSVDPYRLVE